MIRLEEAVREALRRERGEEVAGIRPLGKGANSRAWRVLVRGGGSYLAKEYPPARPGEADRLGTEFAALAFLWGHGERAVPEPVCALPAARAGIYGFVPGEKLRPGEVGAPEVREAAGFLERLHGLRHAAGAAELPAAKEACFTLREYVAVVEGRVRALEALVPGDRVSRRLEEYLRGEFAPAAARIARWVEAEAPRRGVDSEARLPPAALTLSPSDFGFHNAIRRPEGDLVFIDFEYFGWDDPAKMAADFFLQPAVPVPSELRGPFCRVLEAFLGGASRFRERLGLVYPVLGLKWCLIMLNAFLRRREGAGADPALLEEQLGKARAYLERVRGEFENRAFPIGHS